MTVSPLYLDYHGLGAGAPSQGIKQPRIFIQSEAKNASDIA